ncbi:MAG TPA: hypothetical protein EYQ68_02350 [Cytophagales bacterium]|nr:hypothetical protein [Cytophagales bacterium]
MTDRFASLKISNTFKKDLFKKNDRDDPKKNTRFDSLQSSTPSNRFVKNKRNNRRFGNNRDYSNNIAPRETIFTQVGTGEVVFTPQYKCCNQKKDKIKHQKKDKKKIEEDTMSAEERALTLAMAEQYQYYTESDEEEWAMDGYEEEGNGFED